MHACMHVCMSVYVHVSQKKHQCEEGVQRGSLVLAEAGTVVVRFDNTHSMLRRYGVAPIACTPGCPCLMRMHNTLYGSITSIHVG